MKIYIDLILILNFGFDFILLLSVSYILKRNIPIYKLMIGGFIGSISILTLFFKINSFELFLIKIFISLLMVLISFGYHNIKYTLKNILYLYISSIVLGGTLYLLNIEFSYKNQGLVFFHNGISINFYLLIILSPIIIYLYVKQCINLKTNYSNYYKVKIYLDKKIIRCNGFLDTGNTLVDPYKNKPIILINKKEFIKYSNNLNKILVPIHTVNNNSILECVKIDKIEIDKIGTKNNVIVGIMKKKINIDGIDCILNLKLMEEMK